MKTLAKRLDAHFAACAVVAAAAAAGGAEALLWTGCEDSWGLSCLFSREPPAGPTAGPHAGHAGVAAPASAAAAAARSVQGGAGTPCGVGTGAAACPDGGPSYESTGVALAAEGSSGGLGGGGPPGEGWQERPEDLL